MKEYLTRDGHMHTPFCPHGSQDSLEDYVACALRLGRKEISFTEHFPLPSGITSEAYAKDCAFSKDEIPRYLAAVKTLQEAYKEKIKINIGFEIDYLVGMESVIKADLEAYGKVMEDAILSVHFVRHQGVYYAIDAIEDYVRLIEVLGSTKVVYDLYYQTVIQSIKADLGEYKPRRIGHPSLVRIFNKKFPIEYENQDVYNEMATLMREKDYAFDFNVAGLRKADCGETYPSGTLLQTLLHNDVQWVAGSDAHEAAQLLLLSEIEKLG